MHERTLTERAANLLEFNRALDQQRMLREQRDTLTSATLLDQLSKAQEEIERLKKERISQTLSDSMTQLRLGSARDHRDVRQSERIISSLEQRLQTSEKTITQLEEKIYQLQKDKEILSKDLSAMHKAPPIQSK
jgi:predicted  nucleic acid-binding Zn-ribbon protein